MSMSNQELRDLENLEGWADRIMAKIVPSVGAPILKSNMFAGRNKKYPI